MRIPSLFVSTATKIDLISGKVITVTRKAIGVVHSQVEGEEKLLVGDSDIPCAAWNEMYRRNGYQVEVRDATAAEIDEVMEPTGVTQ